MTAHLPGPSSLSVAACPLLSAVLPLRYALGPTLAVDTASVGPHCRATSRPSVITSSPCKAVRLTTPPAFCVMAGYTFGKA
uniref:hypothetical protein n=1 Tax=Stutzerimonas xanthomarina TaxID=271420 RepID=UPI003AA893FF